MSTFTESIVEDAALAWLESLGYAVLHGPDIVVGMPGAERGDPSYRDVVLEGRLRQALVRLNPDLPPEALEDAYRKLTRVDAPSLVERNRAMHRMLVDGVTVEYRRKDGTMAGAQARIIDFDTPDNNDWLAVSQFTVSDGQHARRPDVVLFVNGLPLAVIELKNPADENATVWSAFQQLQTYQAQIPALFATNAALVVSDGVRARIGSLGAGREWFKPWRTITGREDAPVRMPELQVVLEGVIEKRRFLDLLRYFIVFEDSGGGKLVKKMAGYHQFHAVNVAVEETLRAAQTVAAGGATDRHVVLARLAGVGLGECSHVIGAPNGEDRLVLRHAGETVFTASRVELRRLWSETSYRMQALRDHPDCAREAFDAACDPADPGLNVRLTFDPAEDVAAPFIVNGARPRVAILREQGVNGQVEMAAAFDRAGFAAVDVHMSDIIAGRITLAEFHGIAACGGFSNGDVLGAGEGWAKSILFNSRARDEFAAFFARSDSFGLGVCNGCQMLSNLHELIAGTELWPRFVRNRVEQFEARLSLVEVLPSPSLFLRGMEGSRLPIAVAHGEGRAEFRADSGPDEVLAAGVAAQRFVDHCGQPAEPIRPIPTARRAASPA